MVIFAVNEREAEFIQMVHLAMSSQSTPVAHALFCSPAEGTFFMSLPMLFFGGTRLAYAVRALLDTGFVALNDRTTACPLTGFMPLHTAPSPVVHVLRTTCSQLIFDPSSARTIACAR